MKIEDEYLQMAMKAYDFTFAEFAVYTILHSVTTRDSTLFSRLLEELFSLSSIGDMVTLIENIDLSIDNKYIKLYI